MILAHTNNYYIKIDTDGTIIGWMSETILLIMKLGKNEKVPEVEF